MDARGKVLAAMQLTVEDRTALAAAAAGGNRRVALVARILLECARGEPDAAVAAAFGISARTVARWRQRFRDDGVAVLGDPGRPDADDLVRAAYLPDGPAGSVPTTRSAAAGLGVSQATVARAWRAAGVHPLPSGLLIGDPWARGHVRAVAGFAVLPFPGLRPVVAAASADDPVPRSAAMRALVFWVVDGPATPWRRRAEDALVMAFGERERLWESAAGWCRAVGELAVHVRDEPGVGGSAGELAAFVRDLDDRHPDGTTTWVHLDGPVAAGELSGIGGAVLRCAPSAATWSALAVRSLAATAAVAEARGLDSGLPRMETAARLMLARSDADTPLRWKEDPGRVADMLPRLRQRRPAPPRRAVPATWSLGEALERLRAACSDDTIDDLPPFEQLVLLRRRWDPARWGEGEVGVAHAVLAGLMLDCDVLEAALLDHCRRPHVELDPWLVARRLGVTTLHAVGQRARARAAGVGAGRRSSASPALPDPREAVQLDAEGRRRDVVGETVEGLLELWREDLVDHEQLLETLPGADDRFGLLAWLVDPARPVLVDWRSDRPGPQERHRAAADAGLVLLADLRHRLRDEQLAWYRIGVGAGVSWRVQGEPYGRAPNAALRHWQRLEQRARSTVAEPAAGGGRERGEWWSGRADAIAAAVASVRQHCGVFEADDDLGLYAWWLAEEMGPTALLGFLDDFAAVRQCADCDAGRAMVVRDETGRGRCPAHGGHGDLAATAVRLGPLAAELKQLRRGAR
ncbi:helix-turn-helix domain-containing protein [Amycolatopsis sp. NPDC004079]|uniref:helix-turn-helix domain-containing protein n=1 Tax=Amycolatopsis sp. NPDC004079 TaxID=3154549 RepID=UPI0033AE60BB